jgi:hypothetical protein
VPLPPPIPVPAWVPIPNNPYRTLADLTRISDAITCAGQRDTTACLSTATTFVPFVVPESLLLKIAEKGGETAEELAARVSTLMHDDPAIANLVESLKLLTNARGVIGKGAARAVGLQVRDQVVRLTDAISGSKARGLAEMPKNAFLREEGMTEPGFTRVSGAEYKLYGQAAEILDGYDEDTPAILAIVADRQTCNSCYSDALQMAARYPNLWVQLSWIN